MRVSPSLCVRDLPRAVLHGFAIAGWFANAFAQDAVLVTRAEVAAKPLEIAVPLTPAITRAEIEAHVRFLASDELDGRATGTPEAERAAHYIGLVLEREGVQPAGDDHTYLQAVPLERTRVTALPELTLKTSAGETIRAVAGTDFDVLAKPIDVKSLRLVVVKAASDIPEKADASVALFIDAPLTKRRQWLESTQHADGEGFGLLVQPGSSTAGDAASLASFPASTWQRENKALKRRVSLTLNGVLLERARKGEIATLSLTTHVEREHGTSYNVLGMLAGAGTSEHRDLAAEAIVFSAHYDHLGEAHDASAKDATGDPSAPNASATVDRIYNGADDDASGVAAVLEIAGAFAAEKPARTLVFLLATGEEIGLLGTDHYLDHPVVPLERTVANLNFEMIGRPDPLVGGAGEMWLTGFELSNLGPAFAAADVPVKVDPRPDQHFFERSDNYAFVLRGVVGQSFSTYNMHGDYHHPSDEADKLDYAHMEACVRASYRASKLVTDGTLRPQWLDGKQPRKR